MTPRPTTLGETILLPALLLSVVSPAPVTAQIPDTTVVVDSLPLPDSLVGPTEAGPVRVPVILSEVTHRHIAHIMESYPESPSGQGLLATGMAEAAIALQHARLAGADSADLGNMQRHMTHVLHAIDPVQVGAGPGLGFGFRPVADQVRTHMALAAPPEDTLPDLLRFHARFVYDAAEGAMRQADEAIVLARRIQRATDPVAAHRLVESLTTVVVAMAHGSDADDDGRVGFPTSEAGLAQVGYHLELLGRVATIRE